MSLPSNTQGSKGSLSIRALIHFASGEMSPGMGLRDVGNHLDSREPPWQHNTHCEVGVGHSEQGSGSGLLASLTPWLSPWPLAYTIQIKDGRSKVSQDKKTWANVQDTLQIHTPLTRLTILISPYIQWLCLLNSLWRTTKGVVPVFPAKHGAWGFSKQTLLKRNLA